MEFKSLQEQGVNCCSSILIESQWNLKFDDWHECPTCRQILIESQWNLKSGQFYCSVVNDGNINRITVEFKTRKAPVKLSAVVYINRITVEFKRESGELTIEGKMILIESQWNLKSGQFYCSVVNDGNINRITVEFKNWRTRNVFRE